MDEDIQEVFDCFERKLDVELKEITAIGGVKVPPRSSDAPPFDVDDSGPLGNLNRIHMGFHT